MKNMISKFIAVIAMFSFSGAALASDNLTTFFGIDINTPFAPQFYDNSTEVEGRKDTYNVPIKDGSIFETATVVRGEGDFPFIVESCTDRANISQIVSVLSYKYEHYPGYDRFYHDPYSDDNRMGIRILGVYELKIFKRNENGSGYNNSKVCVSLMNRSKPNYEWLSEQYKLPLDLYKEL